MALLLAHGIECTPVAFGRLLRAKLKFLDISFSLAARLLSPSLIGQKVLLPASSIPRNPASARGPACDRRTPVDRAGACASSVSITETDPERGE
jgi:hypothetical protein